MFLPPAALLQTHIETHENGQGGNEWKGTDSKIRGQLSFSDHTIVFFTQNVLVKGHFKLPQKVKIRGGKSSVRLVSIYREETGGHSLCFSRIPLKLSAKQKLESIFK